MFDLEDLIIYLKEIISIFFQAESRYEAYVEKEKFILDIASGEIFSDDELTEALFEKYGEPMKIPISTQRCPPYSIENIESGSNVGKKIFFRAGRGHSDLFMVTIPKKSKEIIKEFLILLRKFFVGHFNLYRVHISKQSYTLKTCEELMISLWTHN